MDPPQDEKCPLLCLPDCLMMFLLSYLDATSLYQLNKTCVYFKNIIEDVNLWKHIDARAEPNHSEKVEFCLDKIHEKTVCALFRAKSKLSGVVPENFFTKIIDFENIKVLALENQHFDGDKLTMKSFPRCLEELSLRKTFVKNSIEFFRCSSEHVIHLRVLILDDCQWVNSSCLMSISKYKSLEIISALHCRQLDNDSIAYFGLASMGYKKLKIFDVRYTSLGRCLINSFSAHKQLLAYYFEHERSYRMDEPVKTRHRHDDSMKKIHSHAEMTDRCLAEFFNVKGIESLDCLPKSKLYLDPYGECECNYKPKDEDCDEDNCEADLAPFMGEDQSCVFSQENAVKSDGTIDEESPPPQPSNRLIVTIVNGSRVENVCVGLYENVLHRSVASGSGQASTAPTAAASSSSSNSTETPGPSATSDSNVHCACTCSRSDDRHYSLDHREVPNNTVEAAASRKRRHHDSDTDTDSDDDNEENDGPSQGKRRRDAFEDVLEDVHEGCYNSLCEQLRIISETKKMQPVLRALERAGPSRMNDADAEAASSSSRPDPPAADDNAQRTRPRTLVTRLIYRKDDKRMTVGTNLRSRPGPEFDLKTHLIDIGQRLVNIRRPPNGNASPRVEIFRIGGHVDNGMQVLLEKCPEKKIPLRRLSLRGFNKITDKCLYLLKDLNLSLLDLTYTSCTKEGINGFLSYNPGCRIIHKDFCVCKPRVPSLN